MFKKLLFTTIIFLSALGFSFSQTVLRGKILDSKDNAPIPYINIGILNSEVGTISNKDGTFMLRIPAKHAQEELIFSAIGYTRQSIPIATLVKNEYNNIVLEEKIIQLKNVTVTAKKVEKTDKWIGHGKRPIMLQGRMDYDSATAGAAMAVLVKNDNPEDLIFMEKATLLIAKNTLPEFKIRIRFLEVDSANNNLPGKDIFNESIIETSTINNGWLNFDLTPYNYTMDRKAFFVMYEWIMDDIDRREISNNYDEYIAQNPKKLIVDTTWVEGEKVLITRLRGFTQGTFFGVTVKKNHIKNHKTYIRSHSFGNWERSSGALSAEILMSNQPPSGVSEQTDDLDKVAKRNQIQSVDDDLIKWGENFIKNYDLEGMQLSVSSKNNLLFSKGFGYSDVEKKSLVDTGTRFRIASVSKSLTSAALVKLQSQNKLDLDADVRTYVPSFPKKPFTITLRQLAGHTGGIRDYYEISLDEIFVQQHYASSTEAIDIFKNDSLEYEPGKEFLYSSYGYTLLGAAIEGASKQHYLDYMYDHVWKPLSMDNTYGDVMDSTMVDKSRFYLYNGEEGPTYDLSYSYPTGGLISTTEDLVKFGNELLHGDFLAPEFRNQLFQTQEVKGKPTNYGLGWYTGKDKNGHTIWYHAGELPSSGAMVILYPDDDIVVSVLTNSPIISDAPDGLSEDIQKIAELIYEN